MSEINGYHTLEDRDDIDHREAAGPIKCTSSRAWLGHGYYFWDTELSWAHEWGAQYVSYVIYGARIIINNKTFDLFGSVGDRKIFLEWAEILIGLGIERHRITVPQLIEYVKKNTKFNQQYDAIRAADHPKSPSKFIFKVGGNEKTYIGGERVQLCMINKNNIVSQTFKAVYPAEYVN